MISNETPILICGLGSIGRRHLRNLMALGATNIALMRTGMGSIEDDLPGEFPVENSLDDALDRFQPMGVVVSNPTSLHAPTATAAAIAGAHVFVEKPLAAEMRSALTLQAAVDSAGVRLMVGYHFRFDPGLLKLRELLQTGVLGQPHSASAYWGEYLPDWHPWEDYRESYAARTGLGGGVVHTLSHPLDYLLWLLGPVDQVHARVARTGTLEIEVDDLAEISLMHVSGALSHVHLDYLRRPARHDLEIIADNGIARWDGLRHRLTWRLADDDDWLTYDPADGFERNELFMDEMRHWLAVIAGEAEPACSLENGLDVLQLCLAAHESERAKAAIRVEQQEHSPA